MMRMSDAQQFYVVGIHGAPTPETAPHGVMWRRDDDSSTTLLALWKYRHRADPWPDEVEWWPAPAPPTEQAPPPEPVARWTARNLGCGWSSLRCGPDLNQPSHEDANAAADALNALDRDGVAWGPGRPMSELPETGRVLVRLKDGLIIARANTIQAGDFVCWWPLPGEA